MNSVLERFAWTINFPWDCLSPRRTFRIENHKRRSLLVLFYWLQSSVKFLQKNVQDWNFVILIPFSLFLSEQFTLSQQGSQEICYKISYVDGQNQTVTLIKLYYCSQMKWVISLKMVQFSKKNVFRLFDINQAFRNVPYVWKTQHKAINYSWVITYYSFSFFLQYMFQICTHFAYFL